MESEFSKRGRRALKVGLQAGRHVHVFLQFVDGRNGAAQRSVRRQVEGDGYGGKLSLMIDRKRLGGRSKCEKALSGMALAVVELVVPAELRPCLRWRSELDATRSPEGSERFAEGVYSGEVGQRIRAGRGRTLTPRSWCRQPASVLPTSVRLDV